LSAARQRALPSIELMHKPPKTISPLAAFYVEGEPMRKNSLDWLY